MEITAGLTAIAAIGGLTALLAIVLVIANRSLYVFEDPRIDQVEGMLPNSNCGACGQPGCRAFAEALVKGAETPAGCTVSSDEGRKAIAAFLGVGVGSAVKRVARLACGGGINVARNRSVYTGISSCQGAVQVSTGGKGCVWGCLGFGDCADVCDFDAINMNRWGLPEVDVVACTACGDCVDICPRDLFSIQPVDRRLWVNCKSQAEGDGVLADCEVGCTACVKCVKDAAPGLMEMQNNLPVIDYTRNHLAKREAIDRCESGAIVWLDDEGRAERGKAAPTVLRKSARPPAGLGVP